MTATSRSRSPTARVRSCGHDRRRPHQVRAGQGAEATPAPEGRRPTTEVLTAQMLRFSTPKVIAFSRSTLSDSCSRRRTSLRPRRARRCRASFRAGSRPGLCRTRRSCSGSISRAARTCCSRSTGRPHPDAGIAAARGRAPHPARDPRRHPGRHRSLPRGVQVRVPDAADRDRLLPRLRELDQPIGNADPRPVRHQYLDVSEQPTA